MKKLIALILCLSLVFCSASAGEIVHMEFERESAPGVQLGMDLLSMLHVTGENTLISPQSLALALAMAAEGAEGETLDEILAVLEADSLNEVSTQLPEELKSANTLFSAPELELKTEYLNRLQEAYAAEGFHIDADVVENVNAWVQEHTDGLIEEMLQSAPNPEIGLILLNALAMDAHWAAPFAAQGTAEEIFHAAAGDVNVQMMHQTAMFDYAEKDGMQILCLPYMDSSLEMWIAMPPQGAMAQLLEILANEGMYYLKSDTEMREVILSLPKMDISGGATLSDALQLLGVESAFGADANFSGISDTPLCIDEIMQKVRVQVDEDGTRAAAATMLVMKAMAAFHEVPPVEMVVNRPFVFVISDRETGAVCFAGAVENPAEN